MVAELIPKNIHRLSACYIGGYTTVHLFNHFLALDGIDTHIAFMESFRLVYRVPLVEIMLLSCVLLQVLSGVFFLKKRWGIAKGSFQKLQSISGAYLAFFLLNHVAAVLYGRNILDLDTNFYFAAAGIHITPFHYFFIPYYFFAVLAIFIHGACAFHWLSRQSLAPNTRDLSAWIMIAAGAILAFLVTLAFAGGFYVVDIPSQYEATYGVQNPLAE